MLLWPFNKGEMRIIAFIIDHKVVGAILRPLAKAEAQFPRGPQSYAALSAAFWATCRQQSPVRVLHVAVVGRR